MTKNAENTKMSKTCKNNKKKCKKIIEHTQMYSPCCNNESGSDKQLTDALEDNRILYNTIQWRCF